jgi:hypothetical protein
MRRISCVLAILLAGCVHDTGVLNAPPTNRAGYKQWCCDLAQRADPELLLILRDVSAIHQRQGTKAVYYSADAQYPMPLPDPGVECINKRLAGYKFDPATAKPAWEPQGAKDCKGCTGPEAMQIWQAVARKYGG